MLQHIRDRAQGWFAWVIVGFITVPFALWGIQQFAEGPTETHVASVGEYKLEEGEYRRALQREQRALRNRLGNDVYDRIYDEKQMKNEVLDGLIKRAAILAVAESEGFGVADQMVVQTIQEVDAFKGADGKFDQAMYEQALRYQGLTPRGFEYKVYRDLLNQQYERAVRATAFVTATEVAQLQRLEGQQRNLSWFVVPFQRFMESVEVTDEQLKAYYDSNLDRFKVPEKVLVQYIELSVDELGAEVETTEDELRAYYEEQKVNFTRPESRHARHILIGVPADADADAEAAARDKAQAALDRIRGGEEFAAVAAELSEDEGSATNGGDLGFFSEGDMFPGLDEAVFAMSVGDVSDPVRSSFGFHVVEVMEIRTDEVNSFDEMRDELVAQHRREAGEKRFYDLSENLANLAYEFPDSLEPAAEELGITIKESSWISRGSAGTQDDPAERQLKFVAAAFDDDVLGRGNNSEVIELSSDHLVVLRVKSHELATSKPFDEVKVQITSEAINDGAREAARNAASDALESLRNGEDMAAVTEALDVTIEDPVDIKRGAGTIDSAIVQAAFRMPRPVPGVGDYALVIASNGDAVVMQLHTVTDGNPEEMDATRAAQAKMVMQRLIGAAEFEGVVRSLQARTKVKIYRERL